MIAELFLHLFSSRGFTPVAARIAEGDQHAALGDCFPHHIVAAEPLTFHVGNCKQADTRPLVGKIPHLPSAHA